MLEKQMIKFILSKWNYGNFRIVFWDQEEFCRRKNKISIWKNKTSIKVEILFFYKP